MEQVPCPISNSTDFIPWLEVPDRFDTSGKYLWQLVQSSVSGLVMLNPRPGSADIAPYYHNDAYDPYLSSRNASTFRQKAILAIRSLLLHYRARLILNKSSKPHSRLSILEIGASTGELLNVFHRYKGIALHHLEGVEPHAASATHAREVFGLNISPSLNSEYHRTFDRIVLWHTLEHLHDINETLEQVTRLLAPDGLLVITLPNAASTGAGRYKEEWIAWDAPRHLYHFVPGTLEKLLAQHRLTIIKQQPYLPDTFYNVMYSEELSCQRNGRSFNALRICAALCKATIRSGTTMLAPERSDGIIYFVRALP